MSYLPARRSGKANVPSAPVTVSRVPLVPAFLSTTVAPGSTPPPESVTVPEIWPVNPCACTELIVPANATSSADAKTILQRRDITCTPPGADTKRADFHPPRRTPLAACHERVAASTDLGGARGY